MSVGVVDGVCMLDLPYEEDSRAEVDMNVVMTSSGRFIEVQGTAEGMPFTKGELDEMLSLAEHGIAQLLDLQTEALADSADPSVSGRRSMKGLQLVVASANPDKAAEITAILGSVAGVELRPRPSDVPDVEETGDTLVDNARLKAVALMEATGIAAVSDDTGLEVDALGGAPGVYSARFSGAHATYAENVAKLMSELERVGATTPAQRRAVFRSVAFVAFPRRRRGVG